MKQVHKYKASDVSPDLVRIFDMLDFDDDADESRKFFRGIQDYSARQLIEKLEIDENLVGHEKRIIKDLISAKLGISLVGNLEYLMDRLDEEFGNIYSGLESLKGLKKHRHKVGEGHYSEVPAW